MERKYYETKIEHNNKGKYFFNQCYFNMEYSYVSTSKAKGGYVGYTGNEPDLFTSELL